VAMSSWGDLASGPSTPDAPRVFVRDRATSTTTQVSGGGTPAYVDALEPTVSADGRYVFFIGQTGLGRTEQAYRYDGGAVSPAPVVSITSGPPTSSADPTPTFTFSSPTATRFECSLPAATGVFTSCASPFTASTLPPGAEVFAVRGVDAAGRTGTPTAYGFVITAGGPATACQTATHLITGTTSGDTLAGTRAGDLISGLEGDDTLTGKAGDDCLVGGIGNDHLVGSAGNDELVGGDGNDSIAPGPGADVVDAGAGDDKVSARDGVADRVDCGPGNDTATVDAADVVTSCETVHIG
jgi:hypothetical protein